MWTTLKKKEKKLDWTEFDLVLEDYVDNLKIFFNGLN